mmetsp:Transcript_26332/g.75373  ORF Transcript_26332/g.75373 Transcript_26332/m.75373 type:complete len:100 (-) Transcript_26332:254-553(-)
MASARPILPAILLLALAACAAVHSFSPAFVAAPNRGSTTETGAVAAMGGAALTLLTAAPAHAAMLVDEIIPYAGATSFCIMWGIVLGFVLLRLQEAFPE